MKNIDAKFRAAWEVFARTCAAAVAPEATFQAWFAHYLLSQFGIDRAAPGPIFKHALLAQPGGAWCPAAESSGTSWSRRAGRSQPRGRA
jgi:hypothetical protein